MQSTKKPSDLSPEKEKPHNFKEMMERESIEKSIDTSPNVLPSLAKTLSNPMTIPKPL